jgi:hypothetical protein
MRQKTKKPTLQLKKESLRNLRTLAQQDLLQVAGGYVYAPGVTCRCDRAN